MLFGELLDDERKAGREEGEVQLLNLMKAMINDHREADLPKLLVDPDFLKAIKKQYSMESVSSQPV